MAQALTKFDCCQVIEEPVEIIDNERELKGFYNMDEVIKLVGYFKSERSSRRWRLRSIVLLTWMYCICISTTHTLLDMLEAMSRVCLHLNLFVRLGANVARCERSGQLNKSAVLIWLISIKSILMGIKKPFYTVTCADHDLCSTVQYLSIFDHLHTQKMSLLLFLNQSIINTIFSSQTSLSMTMLQKSFTPLSSSSPHLTPRFVFFVMYH